MPSPDDAGSTEARASSARGQQSRSRRSVLRGAATAGVAGIAAAALAGTGAPAFAAAAKPAARGRNAETTDAASAEPIVVHVRDARSGEMDVFRGTGQVRLRDPELTARIVRASR
jgi:anaerobic selenocysteine-containing dehydrogenase